MTIPVIRKRAKRPKTRTGCRTCRQRHIKCDEERPACRRCTISGRVCDGYEMSLAMLQGGAKNPATLLPKHGSPTGLSEISTPAAVPSSPFDLSAIERQAYEYFKWQTAHQLPGSSWAPSWEKLALQVGEREHAVMHAMIAVGAMHQWSSAAFEMRNNPSLASIQSRPVNTCQHEFAISQYNKSMEYMQTHIKAIARGGPDSNVEIVLLVCLLFVCFEILQDSESSAVLHLRTGLRILYDCVSRSEPKTFFENDPNLDGEIRRPVLLKATPQSMMDILLHTFVQLDSDLTLFGMQEPYLHPTCGTGVPYSFLSIEEARLHLDVLTSIACHARGRLLRFAEQHLLGGGSDYHGTDEDSFHCMLHATSRTVHIPDSSLFAQMQDVRQNLASWMSALAFIPIGEHNEANRAHLLIQIQFFYIWFMVSTWRDDNETLCDRFEDQFSHVLGLAERYVSLSGHDSMLNTHSPSQSPPLGAEWKLNATSKLPFTLGTGIWPCIYIVATKCRTSQIRRRALAILQSITVQGFIDSFVLASFTSQIIDLEETRARKLGGFPDDYIFQCHEVPEAARFFDVTLAGGPVPTVGRIIRATQDDWPSLHLSIGEDLFDLQGSNMRSPPTITDVIF
ncbi:Hypothetical protein R9X50_00243400 [Acrodontium crateriforme]|uniref:Zn(2)-C6 fungal-type domain-containing protein n=1 Tax=Acrodontium crateriforme TaxID=150365 RepID=A0AAQ3M261_9PEZI|nr:Hypothetical protein R9X50_00243400 [Acrodontium crateriforme]